MGEYTDIVGATGKNYQPSNQDFTKRYRRKAISTVPGVEGQAEAFSNELQITVVDNDTVVVLDQEGVLMEVIQEETIIIVDDPMVNPGTIAAAQTIHVGETPVLLTTGVAGDTPISYEWYVSTEGPDFGTMHRIFEETSENYQPPALTACRWYCRRNFVSGGEVGTTPAIKITVLDESEQPVYDFIFTASVHISGIADMTYLGGFTFTADSQNGGDMPIFFWYLKDVCLNPNEGDPNYHGPSYGNHYNISQNYIDMNMQDLFDAKVHCVMVSTLDPVLGSPATSNFLYLHWTQERGWWIDSYETGSEGIIIIEDPF